MQADKNTSIFLKDLADITMGQSPAGSSMNEQTGMEFHQGKTNFGSVFLNCSKVKTKAPTKIANKDDIVICVRAPVGVVNITNRKICIGRGLAALSPKELVDRDYLFYALQASQKAVEKLAAGSTFSSIPGPELCKLELPKQTYEKQKSIGRALSSADKAIAIIEKQISKYEHIKKSTEKMLLTPKADWQQVRLGDIVDYYKGCGLSKEKLSSNGNYPCILYGELFTKYNEIIDEVQSKTFITEGFSSCYDDVLLPGSTTTCGEDLIKASAILQDDVLLGGDIIVLRPNKRIVCGRFLAYLISQYKKDMLKYTQGITIIHLQGHKMMDLQIKIPNLVVQRDIVNNIIKIDEHLKQLRYSLDKLCNIKTGMMSYFFG